MANEWGDDDDRIYKVVVNHEEQYSIWFADRELPLGWKPDDFAGTKQECLDHIEAVWTDMHPPSLRKKYGRDGARRGLQVAGARFSP